MIWVPYVDQNCASVDDWWKMILGYAALYQNHECVNLTFQCSDIKKKIHKRDINNMKGGDAYFGSWFLMFQSVGRWLHWYDTTDVWQSPTVRNR